MHLVLCTGLGDPDANLTSVTPQNSLAYATRVRTIKNDVTKIEASKEMMRLKRQVASLCFASRMLAGFAAGVA